MLLEEVIQRVQSMYSRGLQSKDSRLTSRHIYSTICSARSILLAQQYNKGQKISQWAYQSLECVELVPSLAHECGPNQGELVLKTKNKIPQPITGIKDHLIQSITDIEGNLRFDATSFSNRKYSKGNKYTANKPQTFIKNQHLFITVKKKFKAITIVGLFGDVIEAQSFIGLCEGEKACFNPMLMEFPIDEDLIVPLIQLANQELINMFKQMTEDKLANASDDTSSGMVHQSRAND